MKIIDYDKLKFTSLKYGVDIIHFKYDEEDYTLKNGGTEYTLVTHLYKGRTKYNLQHIKGCYGNCFTLIKYIGNKRTLKYIDKENFVLELVKLGILEPTEEQEKIIKKQKIKIKEQEINIRKEQIKRLEEQIKELNK